MSNQKESKTRHDLAKAVIDETDSSASPSSASLFCVGGNDCFYFFVNSIFDHV